MKRTNRVLIFSAIAVISMGCGMSLTKDKSSPTPEVIPPTSQTATPFSMMLATKTDLLLRVKPSGMG